MRDSSVCGAHAGLGTLRARHHGGRTSMECVVHARHRRRHLRGAGVVRRHGRGAAAARACRDAGGRAPSTPALVQRECKASPHSAECSWHGPPFPRKGQRTCFTSCLHCPGARSVGQHRSLLPMVPFRRILLSCYIGSESLQPRVSTAPSDRSIRRAPAPPGLRGGAAPHRAARRPWRATWRARCRAGGAWPSTCAGPPSRRRRPRPPGAPAPSPARPPRERTQRAPAFDRVRVSLHWVVGEPLHRVAAGHSDACLPMRRCGRRRGAGQGLLMVLEHVKGVVWIQRGALFTTCR